MDCETILKSLDLLYVEDEEQIRQMMQEVLQEDFRSFDTAANGIEGLHKVSSKRYDCIVTDIEMEGMDGLALAKKIKEKDESIVVILLTAYSEKERLFKAIDIGVNKYLVKPFTPEKLLQTICEIFSKRLQKEQVIALGRAFLYEPQRAVVKREGEEIKLTKKEKLFLDLLLQNRDRIVSFAEIENSVWAEGEFSENALRTLVKRLRKKLYKELILSHSGLGYKINL